MPGEKDVVLIGVLDNLKDHARRLKNELYAVYYACKDKRTPKLPKIIALIALAYALSPIDLIPDFIPFFGYLDDLIIIPALLAMAIKMIPDEIMNDARNLAKANQLQLNRNYGNYVVAAVFVAIWTTVAAVIIYLAFQYFR